MRRFDPFNNRQARDIRNNLSAAFLQAISQKNGSIFRKSAASYLQLDPEPIFANYIQDRLDKYEGVFAEIIGNDIYGLLEQAAILWERQLYFEMHEILEGEWKQASGTRRLALQAVIRAAGMKIHAANNNTKAATSMAAKALPVLREHRQELGNFTALDDILAELENGLAAADR